MSEAVLEFPSMKHKDMIKAYQEETFAAGEFYINGDGGCHQNEDYQDWLEKAKNYHLGVQLPDGYVPATTYFLVGENKILGTINIRHRLNEGLLKSGGHIGYSVAPSERKKGYATTMLKMGLMICHDLGIDRVLVTCNKENIASRKTIEKCGGQLENEYYDEDELQTYLRFWIGEDKND
ncbi:MAG: GNAT family N-acetyltransferase [Beduini sp.]|uniref:GNAT family N-acetyltransferase n=1 Tax=Beduini sp. TaxID=1922300 RepID=UPI0039A37A2C